MLEFVAGTGTRHFIVTRKIVMAYLIVIYSFCCVLASVFELVLYRHMELGQVDSPS